MIKNNFRNFRAKGHSNHRVVVVHILRPQFAEDTADAENCMRRIPRNSHGPILGNSQHTIKTFVV